MNRKIFFRGLRKVDNVWVNGFYSKNNHYQEHYIYTNDDFSPHQAYRKHIVKISTVSQYIGLKDKNGNKIFEGDIVRWDDMSNGEKWRVAVVEFNPDIQFRIIRIECDFIQSAKEGYVFRFGSFIYKDTHNHLEVIGNIHDNE